MTSLIRLIKIFVPVFVICCSSLNIMAQDLSNIGKQKPFTISGSIGASYNFYNSNEPVQSRPSSSWNIYGNFTPTVYGVALPFSFLINQYSNSYTQPFTQFGLSPTYKWAKLHIGYRNMQFSPLTFDGQSFRGVGIELTPKNFRFGAFYGKLNRKVNEDTTSGRFAAPQFSRTGYGMKIGVGNSNNYFDLIYFHAKDDSSSATVINKLSYRPQENTVIGSSFKVSLLKKIILNTDFAISGLTEDLATDSVKKPSLSNWAGQSSLQLILQGYTTTLGYRRVQPGFKSLGTPYMLNDIELINWMNNFSLAQGKLNITAILSNQHNNLDKALASELQTFVSNLNVNALLSKQFNVNINYNGYNLKQKDGTIKQTDSSRLNQQILQLGVTPSWTISNESRSNTISGNVSYMMLDDKNPATTKQASSNNLSGSLNYSLGFIKQSANVTISGLFSQYRQDTNYYKTYGITLSSAAQLLKERPLSIQGSIGYLINRSSFGNAQNNLTFSGNIGYHVKHHMLNAYANYIYTPYNPINNIINNKVTQAVASKNLAGGISYNYSF